MFCHKVQEDKKVPNENWVVKLPNDTFYSVRMNSLVVQILNTRKGRQTAKNSTEAAKTLTVSKLE